MSFLASLVSSVVSRFDGGKTDEFHTQEGTQDDFSDGILGVELTEVGPMEGFLFVNKKVTTSAGEKSKWVDVDPFGFGQMFDAPILTDVLVVSLDVDNYHSDD